jgi:SAM-dependent methyltransferase/DNA-binding transcriptional ArsR family regulator
MTGPAGSAEYLRNLLVGHIPVQLACAMAGLRLADLLADGPMTVDELSAAAKARPDMLRRLLRGLADIGLVTLDRDGRVSATEMGALLRSGTTGSMRDLALYRGGPSYTSWGKLEHTVRTGDPAFEAALGAPFFSYMRDHPEDGAAFDGGMARLSLDIIDETLARYDFSVATHILDVGGGRGHFAAAVLEAYPQLDGAVLDLPERIEAADEYLRGRGLGERCVAIGGNFFDSVPVGYDLHILKWILHDWNDASCRRLLAQCRAALPADGRLLVVELLLPDGAATDGRLRPAIQTDLFMLVNFADSRERSLDEYERMLGDCGFALEQAIALPSSFGVLDFRPQ